MAKARARNANSSKPFTIDDFDYGNSFVADLMMQNWDNLAFTGITVCTVQLQTSEQDTNCSNVLQESMCRLFLEVILKLDDWPLCYI